ncbi:MAG: DUF4389 domain-containing protein [Pseudomonadales bacterium]|nr:DUF4389 domain-containing protein [Pseudomonadales bacterium]
MEREMKDRLNNPSLWKRALFMLIFALIRVIAEGIVSIVALFQFVTLLLTGQANSALIKFGNNLSAYIYQVAQFLTFNSETHPFPLSDWPCQEPETGNCWLDDGYHPNADNTAADEPDGDKTDTERNSG